MIRNQEPINSRSILAKKQLEMNTLNEYVTNLSPESKRRYLKKIEKINGIDPYTLGEKDFTGQLYNLPRIHISNVYQFLIFQESQTTQKQIRTFKTIDAYIQVACNWITHILLKKIKNNYLVYGRVKHSERTNEDDLKVWVILHENEILSVHCNCVAGLEEVCIHATTLLFAIIKLQSSEDSFTDIFPHWKGGNSQEIHLPMKKMKWSVSSDDLQMKEIGEVPAMSNTEIINMIQALKDGGCSPVLQYSFDKFLE